MKGDTVAQKLKVEDLESLHQEVNEAVTALPKVSIRAKDALIIGEGYTALARSLYWALQSDLPDATARATLEALQVRMWRQLTRIESEVLSLTRAMVSDEQV